ncbi:hypothetical protein BCR35DRAFT_351075 [Leucosporidium creatinivorum]|uniref:DUF6697 domain-containing protein n=1 Tax=Leucosporidium creatinivorum TaxID=106004 RepID=A0A1Y2FW75_9BASI|nr:hypothetical protein BCR35DRAFT_351075 [Leucosporidium creatinivorum]
MDQPTAASRASTCPRLNEPFAALEAQILALGALPPQPNETGAQASFLTSFSTVLVGAPWSTLSLALKRYFDDITSIDLQRITHGILRLLDSWLKAVLITEDEQFGLELWLLALANAARRCLSARQQSPSAPLVSPSLTPVVAQGAEKEGTDVAEDSIAINLETRAEALDGLDDSSAMSSLTPESEIELKLEEKRAAAEEVDTVRMSSPAPRSAHRFDSHSPASSPAANVENPREAGPSPEGKLKKRARSSDPAPMASLAAGGKKSTRTSKRQATAASAPRPRDTTSDGATPGPSNSRRAFVNPTVAALRSPTTSVRSTTPRGTPPLTHVQTPLVDEDQATWVRRSSRGRQPKLLYDGTPALSNSPSSSLQSSPAPAARKPRSPSPERPILAPAPAVAQVETDTPFGALLRRTLRLPADVVLSNPFLTDPQYYNLLSIEPTGYTRIQMGGAGVKCCNLGMGSGTYSASEHHLSMQPKMNLVRHHINLEDDYEGVVDLGEPLVFVSHVQKTNETLRCARIERPDHQGEVNIFICHGPNDWRYKGRYEVAYEGTTPSGAFAELDEEQTALVQDVVAGHLACDIKESEKGWSRSILKDWGVRLKPVEKTMKDFRTKEEAKMRFVVMRCVGWDAESVTVWDNRPRKKSGKSR